MEAQALKIAEESQPWFDVVVTSPGSQLSETSIRSIARRCRAKLQFLQMKTAQRAHLRLATLCVYDLVIALEAVGFEVVRVVATSR